MKRRCCVIPCPRVSSVPLSKAVSPLCVSLVASAMNEATTAASVAQQVAHGNRCPHNPSPDVSSSTAAHISLRMYHACTHHEMRRTDRNTAQAKPSGWGERGGIQLDACASCMMLAGSERSRRPDQQERGTSEGQDRRSTLLPHVLVADHRRGTRLGTCARFPAETAATPAAATSR